MSDSAIAILTAAGVLVSAVAVVVSGVTASKQAKLAAQIHKEQADLSKTIHREQLMLSQRQLFLEIWPKMESLNVIDLNNVVSPDVVRSVNVLELVALCWEGEMVDSGVIRRSFGSRYLELYETITKVPEMKNPRYSGSQLLLATPAIGKLYDQLRKDAQEQGALKPLPSSMV